MAEFDPKKITLSLLVLALVVVGVTLATTTHQPGGTTVVLVGRSGSDHPAAVAECVEAAITQAVDDGAQVYLAPVARGADLRWRRVATALTGSARTNPLSARGQRRDARAKLDRIFVGIVTAQRPAGASDLVAATAAAGRLMRFEEGPRRLVVCADTHQVGSGIDVYRDPLDDRSVRAAMDRIRGALPDLRQVDVVMGAAGLDDEAELTPTQVMRVERFWTVHWRRAVRAKSLKYDAVAHV